MQYMFVIKLSIIISITNSIRDCSQEIKRRLKLRNRAMETLGKVPKSKNVSLGTRLALSALSHSHRESWPGKEAGRKSLFI